MALRLSGRTVIGVRGAYDGPHQKPQNRVRDAIKEMAPGTIFTTNELAQKLGLKSAKVASYTCYMCTRVGPGLWRRNAD